MTGTMYLIGTGPGDPELLTLKAARLLAKVPVIAYPATENQGAMALEIARRHINPNAKLIPVSLPMRLDRAPAQAAYDIGARAIQLQLDAGCDVAYLCEGDPLFYGSAMYLLDRIDAPVAVVPGITSLTAAAAAIVRPLAARNETLKILPAPLPDERLKAELGTTPAAAIIKVGRHFDRIRGLLEATGHAQNAVVVEFATGQNQRITKLSDFAHDTRPYFSIILCSAGEEAWSKS
ncbi:precorrin-2 C(20)-methyltransferase [Devosia rhodophyticola]|uniref:Precorrin-2 C(20)-methyltransferase n=1 Tax=Devosia rhodophyticola TaxID=3026423 RepID=A0ABY7YYX5_9HYPH|nr:precorrin-2 C(20)-methyltransferase [Devosia rhodophyticola]WDR06593.1 precorrin-2 C(20)-methyltransferase [Devosia rhodophyticola]